MTNRGRHAVLLRCGPALVLVTAVLVGLIAAPAASGSGRFFGLDYTFTELHNRDAQTLAKSGAKTVRWTFAWPRIEPSSGNFKWSDADRFVGAMAARGISVLPVLDRSPRWVSRSAVTPPISSPQARNAWKGFLRQAVERYGPRGSYWTLKYRTHHPGKRALPIRKWQIWNEPNLKKHFQPHPSPHRYARLLKLSHSAIKGADRHAKVMFAGMPGYSNDINAWSFLKRVYQKHGAAHDFDIAALHPYARNVKQMLGEVGRLRKVMKKNGDRRKPLWITEIGWGSGHPNRFGLTKGKRGQARILRHSLHALKRKRHNWHIDRAVWFNYRDPKGGGSRGCAFCASSGLLKSNFHPKPAWRAFRGLTR